MIYTFNLMIGIEPNGVDVAQAYRGRILRELQQEARFVFTHIPPREKLDYFLSLGHPEEEVLLAHLVLTDQEGIGLGITVDDMEERLGLGRVLDEEDLFIRYEEKNGVWTVLHRNRLKPDYVDFVDSYVHGHLLRRDHYGKTKLYSEYFTAILLDIGYVARPCRRVFFNQDGTKAYEQILKSTDFFAKSIYRLGDEWLDGDEALMERIILELDFQADDHIIVDRCERLAFMPPLFRHRGQAKLSFVFHSLQTWQGNVVSEYVYLFQQAKHFDYFLVSSQAQKEDLVALLGRADKIRVLPVGALEKTYASEDRKPFSLMVASRFEPRKRLDLTIAAVAAFHKICPQVTLDIYGKGMLWGELEAQISDLEAGDYIHLRGHQVLEERFKDYQVYLTTSEWETFGLTLLEAIGSGLALVGLDAPYGNQTFIQEGVNGYRIPFTDRSQTAIVDDLVDALGKTFNHLEAFQAASYHLAEKYLQPQLVEEWRTFLQQSKTM